MHDARVYDALVTADGIRHRWTRDADLDSKIGVTGEFRVSYQKPVLEN